MTAEAGQSREATGGAEVSELAAGWLAPNYLVGLHEQLADLPHGPERFALLRKATGDVVSLQLAGIWAGRLKVEQEKLLFLRQKHQDTLELAKVAAAAQVEQKRLDPNRPMTDEELKACVDKVDEIFGLKPTRAVATHAVGAPI